MGIFNVLSGRIYKINKIQKIVLNQSSNRLNVSIRASDGPASLEYKLVLLADEFAGKVLWGIFEPNTDFFKKFISQLNELKIKKLQQVFVCYFIGAYLSANDKFSGPKYNIAELTKILQDTFGIDQKLFEIFCRMFVNFTHQARFESFITFISVCLEADKSDFDKYLVNQFTFIIDWKLKETMGTI